MRLAEERREFMRVAFKVKGRREASEGEARQGPSCFPAVMRRERERRTGWRRASAASLCKLKVSSTLTSIPVWAGSVLNGAVTGAGGSVR